MIKVINNGRDMHRHGVSLFTRGIKAKGEIKTGKKLVRDSSPEIGISPERKKVVKGINV